MFEDGEKFQRLNIWKLIPKPKDDRPRWRIEFDNGTVAFGKDFQVCARADPRPRRRRAPIESPPPPAALCDPAGWR